MFRARSAPDGKNNNIPSTLPVLPLPAGQVLLPSSAITIQIYSEHNLNLLKAAIADSEIMKQPAIIAVAPLRPKTKESESRALVKLDDAGGKSGSVRVKQPVLQVIQFPSDAEQQSGDGGQTKPTVNDISEWACAARIIRIERLQQTVISDGKSSSQDGYILVVEGVCRVHIDKFTKSGSPYFEAALTSHPRKDESVNEQLVGDLSTVASQLLDMLNATASPPPTSRPIPKLPKANFPTLPSLAIKRLKFHLNNLNPETADEICDMLISTLLPASRPSSYPAKMHHLSLLSAEERIKHSVAQFEILKAELESRAAVGNRYLTNQTRKAREMVLRSLMEAIWQELRALRKQDADEENGQDNDKSPSSPSAALRIVRKGEKIAGKKGASARSANGGEANDDEDSSEDEEDELATLSRKVSEAQMSKEARQACKRELKRLKAIPPQSPEHGVIRNYLDWMTSLPWGKSSYDDPEAKRIDKDFLERARKQLDDDHFGLETVKERLLQYLAVLRLRSEAYEEEGKLLAIDGVEAASSAPDSKDGKNSSKALVKAPPATPSGSTDPDIGPVESDVSIPPAPIPAQKRINKPRPGLQDKGPILLLVGPPGVGKTSIARSLAAALGRPYHRISLGGVRDEAEIRGHRRTYVASMPGVIIQSLRKVQVNNPLILLDEIDKLSNGSGAHGDPSAAMLEVLDPEQNFSFNDHYINTSVDLSSVLFIATANDTSTISAPLLDRMEVIHLGGYVDTEKLQIARKYLLPKVLAANVLKQKHVAIEDETILQIVNRYCAGESGVRTLERQLGSVCRHKAVELARARDKRHATSGDSAISTDDDVPGYNPKVELEDLESILGTHFFEPEIAEEARDVRPGVATGLAYMGSGSGGIMFIEASSMPGKGQLVLTGSLGDVISESAKLAFSWVKSNAFDLGLSSSRQQDIASGLDIHLHCPAGSISKNGPSAGGVMVLCMVSMFSGHTLDPHLAMTGEMTLRGKITPIGGVKEKCLGAHRAGIRKLILPERNRKDFVADVPEVIKNDIQVHFVDNIWQALEIAFGDKVGTAPGEYIPIGGTRTTRHLVNGLSRL